MTEHNSGHNSGHDSGHGTEHGRRLRVGLTQWHPTRDVAANLAVAVDLLGAAGPEADLVLLPENGLMLGSNAEMRAAALAIDSPEIGALRDAAKAARTVVVLGGFKRRAGAGEVYNTALVIGADGEIAAGYDKIHLFDARIDGQSFEASSVERAGERPLIVTVAGVRIGVTICYDVRFPELYRTLARAGAEVLLVPAAFTHRTGSAHWEVLLRARAIESAAYVVASATVRGADGSDAFETYGHALAVGPWGDVLADLGEEAPAWRVLDLSLAEVTRVREALPVLRGVRPVASGAQPAIMDLGEGGEKQMTDSDEPDGLPSGSRAGAGEDGIIRAGEPVGIGNEFTGVQVRKVWTRQGERLELHVPRTGRRVLLDAMQLEILTAQDPEKYSELFAIHFDAYDRGSS